MTPTLTIEEAKDKAAQELDHKDWETAFAWYVKLDAVNNEIAGKGLLGQLIDRAMEIYTASAISSVREDMMASITEVLNSCDETLSFIESWVRGSDYNLVYGERIKIQEYLKQLRLLINKPND